MPIRRFKIQKLVSHLLTEFKVEEPPVPVRRIARGCGARIFREGQEGDLSGFLFRRAKEIVIGVNTNHAPVRQRFTIAHELGHLLLHDVDELHVDRGFMVRLRSDISSLGLDENEMEANRFAAELLMPTRFLKRDLEGAELNFTDDATLRLLARRYGVSAQALAIRLSGLGYLPAVET